MVGRLVDSDGKPIAGVLVESLEAETTTDADGRFAVQYKAPDQFVHFVLHETWYQRTFLPDDEGHEVLVQLPRTGEVQARCELGLQTEIELSWDLGAGLTARRTAACGAGASASLVLGGVPNGLPRGRSGARAIDVEGSGGAIRLFPPAFPVKVEVRAEDAAQLPTCLVQIGGLAATRGDDGTFIGQGRGLTTVSAICAGHVAVPQAVRVDAETSVTLEVAHTSPTLDLESVLPGASAAWLTREGADGYTVPLTADNKGTWVLPPLTAGVYLVAVGDAANALRAGDLVAPSAGTLYVKRVAEGEVLVVVGRLRVDQDIASGAIPVSVAR